MAAVVEHKEVTTILVLRPLVNCRYHCRCIGLSTHDGPAGLISICPAENTRNGLSSSINSLLNFGWMDYLRVPGDAHERGRRVGGYIPFPESHDGGRRFSQREIRRLEGGIMKGSCSTLALVFLVLEIPIKNRITGGGLSFPL